jgi:hypothetical protein
MNELAQNLLCHTLETLADALLDRLVPVRP